MSSLSSDARLDLRGLRPGDAAEGQGVVLESGIWVPGDVVRGLTSDDTSVTITDNGDGTFDLAAAGGGGGGVPTSRLISTGTGLTGGGDLTADRTLSIDTTAEAERIRDTMGTALVAGANITLTVDDPGDTITIAAAGGGGGGGSTFPLDPVSLHATYGDDFTGASLDAKWSRQGWTSTGELFQQGDSTWFEQDTSKTTNSYYYQAAPAGDFTLVMKAIQYATSSDMFGLVILDNSGNGVCSVVASGEGNYVRTVSAGTQTTPANGFGAASMIHSGAGSISWYKLNKSGTSYKASFSTNGHVWRPWTTTITSAITPTRIGFGNVFGTCLGFAVDWFDVQ